MLKLHVPADSIRLIAIDIDGTLLNPEFRISATDLATLRRRMPRASRSFWSPDGDTLLRCPSRNNWDSIFG